MSRNDPKSLLDAARQSFADGKYARAYGQAQAAVEILKRPGGSRAQGILCRSVMAHCLERQGDSLGALKLHKENARLDSQLEDTYLRLAELGEKHGDLEAVRMGCEWLQNVAGQFGLVDLRAKRRTERVERLLARGEFGPQAGQPGEKPASTGKARDAGCAVLIAFVAVALVGVLRLVG